MSVRKYVDALDNIESSLEELGDFVDVCRKALHLPGRFLQVKEILDKGLGVHIKNSKLARLRSAIGRGLSVGEDAQGIITSDFGYLFGLAVVRLWTALEATFNDFALALLDDQDRWKTVPSVQRMKVILTEFMAMPRPEQMRFILEHVTTESKARSAPGLARYEVLMKTVGLGGMLPPALERPGMWLGEARHVLVHNRGIADERFVRRCPWSGVEVGQKIVVTSDAFFIGRAVVRAYIALVGLRLEQNGLDVVRPGRSVSVENTLKRIVQHCKKPTMATMNWV